MSKLIALKSGSYEILDDAWNYDLSKLKQQALLFDQIGIYKLTRFYEILEETLGVLKKLYPNILNKGGSIIAELEWLEQIGVVFELNLKDVFHDELKKDFATQVSIQKFEDAKDLFKKITEIQTSELVNAKNETHKTQLIKEQHFALLRLMSIIIEITKGDTAVTTFPYLEYAREFQNSRKSDVIQIIINQLPLPDNETPWEQIIDFRNASENQNNLLNLRRWIRKVSAEDHYAAEIEEIEWLMREFQSHMKLHKLKANTETLEVLVKAPLEIIENLIKVNISKIPEPFFAFKKRQINLLKAELNAPGREIAYIIKARETFQSQE